MAKAGTRKKAKAKVLSMDELFKDNGPYKGCYLDRDFRTCETSILRYSGANGTSVTNAPIIYRWFRHIHYLRSSICCTSHRMGLRQGR